MLLQFPKNFFWGTSTAAAQIETPSEHIWRGVKSRDNFVFDRTTDHELRRTEDAELIKRFGTVYRCGVDWARLQNAPFAPFNQAVIDEYSAFFSNLTEGGVKIMFVIHHFTHPIWFEEKGSFREAQNIPIFLDFTQKCIQHFGKYVSYWNTFNEPNVYTYNAYIGGDFPPFQKGKIRLANRFIGNMSKAHNAAYTMLKKETPSVPVGISLNTIFTSAHNFLGWLPSRIFDWWFNVRAASLFEQVDFWGVSYYAHIPFDPLPITEITTPGKPARLGYPHDKMWCYNPEAFGFILKRIWHKYQKPIIITENGICTTDNSERISALKDYLRLLHQLIAEGIDIQGYIYWTIFDNFEWSLGKTYCFGLLRTDFDTCERINTPAADYYEKVTKENAIEI